MAIFNIFIFLDYLLTISASPLPVPMCGTPRLSVPLYHHYYHQHHLQQQQLSIKQCALLALGPLHISSPPPPFEL